MACISQFVLLHNEMLTTRNLHVTQDDKIMDDEIGKTCSMYGRPEMRTEF